MARTRKGTNFTAEEDMHMWRFAMEKKHGSSMWKEFKNGRKTARGQRILYRRFRDSLLPHLPVTKFHTETKLKLCKYYKFPVNSEFLTALKKDASITLDNERIVTAYTMKPAVRPNTDMELDDEEFLELTSPIIRKHVRFTEKDDAEICNYFIKHYRRYIRGSLEFWKDLIHEKKLSQTPESILSKFKRVLAPNLHKSDFDTETKLEVYKSSKIPVDPEYLKTLEEHYDLEVDEKGCIVQYGKIDDGKCRSSNEKKLEQRELLSVKTEDVGEPVAKRQRYEKEFYIDSESEMDETYSENRFGDFGDVEKQNSIQNFSKESDESNQVLDDEPQRPMPQRRDRETRSKTRNKNIEQKVVITKNTEKKTMKRTRISEESRSSSSPMIPENQLDANGSIAQLQELENRIVEKLTPVVQNGMVTVSENLIDAKMTKFSNNLEESLRTEISKVSRAVATLTEEVRDVSQKIQPDGEKESRKKKEFLLNLKNLISSLHAPELEDVEQRIDEAVQNSPEEDVDSNQMRMIRSALDMMLLAIGH